MSASDASQPPVRNPSTLFSRDVEFCADSVEWCPHAPFQDHFVCANYQLQKNEDAQSNACKRVGRVLLFKITPETELELKQTIETAAILDQKWCHKICNNAILLGVVDAKKTLGIYRLEPELQILELLTSYSLKTEEEVLILSLDWSTGKFIGEKPEIICSDSKGNIHRFVLNNDRLILEQSVHGHDFEAWIAGFYYWDINIYFSGGDDCKFLKYDKRASSAVLATNRSHEAGVTALHSNPVRENIVITGSYDENIRFWDLRNMRSPQHSVKMPGTVWRVKWDPFNYNYILVACMLGGIHVINAKEDDIGICVSYYGHKDISYGADWSYLKPEAVAAYNKEHEDSNVIIGTCSFYEHLLCISKFTI